MQELSRHNKAKPTMCNGKENGTQDIETHLKKICCLKNYSLSHNRHQNEKL